jgi:hypothetical protein
MKSHLDELLALRPQAEAPAAAIAGAIEAIHAKGSQYAAEAAALRERREASLLTLAGRELRAMEDEARDLEIAVQQAREVAAKLAPVLFEARKGEALAEVTGKRAALLADYEDFAGRFHAFYREFVGRFPGFMAERAELVAQARQVEAGINVFLDEFIPDEPGDNAGSRTYRQQTARRELGEVPGSPIAPAYETRVCLPAADLAPGVEGWARMAHKGDWWQPKHLEGMTPDQVLARQRKLDEGHAAWAEKLRLVHAERQAGEGQYQPGIVPNQPPAGRG